MERSAGAKVSVRAIIVLASVAVFVFLVDQAAKAAVISHLTEGERVPVIGNLLVFLYTRNPGAAFSIGTGSTWIFTIIAIGVLIFVIWIARRIHSIVWSIVFGLLLGGLLGNLFDRLFRPPAFGQGEVVDFIKIPLLPAIFNLADSAIVLAMALFLVQTLRGVGLNGQKHVAADASAAASPDGPAGPVETTEEKSPDGDA
ncbi:MAG: signal peptidase II [Microbacteriaceae bacterium]|nr:signal peptidase II [Microbacteriaceae bacterium]MCL2794942.1 signal peptidase II [Microbacteriaceae bacterium]